MKYTAQHCCDKTVDGKMPLYRECFFRICTKSMVNEVTFVDRPNRPLLDPPLPPLVDVHPLMQTNILN